jgi:hypothetical protein
MNKSRWSGYAKFLVLSDKSSYKLNSSFTSYLDFKKVKEVINNIAFTDKTTYSYDGNIYNRKITTQEAKNIIANIDECRWTDTTSKMLLVANQLKLRI